MNLMMNRPIGTLPWTRRPATLAVALLVTALGGTILPLPAPASADTANGHVCTDAGWSGSGVHAIFCSDLMIGLSNGVIKLYLRTEAFCQDGSGTMTQCPRIDVFGATPNSKLGYAVWHKGCGGTNPACSTARNYFSHDYVLQDDATCNSQTWGVTFGTSLYRSQIETPGGAVIPLGSNLGTYHFSHGC